MIFMVVYIPNAMGMEKILEAFATIFKIVIFKDKFITSGTSRNFSHPGYAVPPSLAQIL